MYLTRLLPNGACIRGDVGATGSARVVRETRRHGGTGVHSRPRYPFETFSRFAGQMTIPCFTAARLGSDVAIYKSGPLSSLFVRQRRERSLSFEALGAPCRRPCHHRAQPGGPSGKLVPFLSRESRSSTRSLRATEKDNTAWLFLFLFLSQR